MTTESTNSAATPSAPAAAATAPAARQAVRQEASVPPAPVGELLGSTEGSAAEPPRAPAPDTEEPPPAVAPEDVPQQALELVVVAPEAPVARALEPAPAEEAVAPVASPARADTLDFSSLVTRLRKTKAIGLVKKVAVKNESDELLEQFRAYHARHGMATLADLRRAYDLLFHKLHALLKDTDPPLARDIDRSRAAIWELLADPRRFSASELMAGA